MKFNVLLYLSMISILLSTQNKKVTINIEPAEWVKPITADFNGKTPNSAKNNYFLLIDRQINLNEKAKYYHYTNQIIDDQGAENNVRRSFVFDPNYQKLIIHYINIIRNSKIIKKLKRSELKVIQQEKDLKKKLYDGSLTALIFLKDIQVGDILDYAFTIKGFNPAFENKESGVLSLGWNDPVKEVSYRVITKKNNPIYIRNYLTDIQPIINQNSEFSDYTWKSKNIEEVLVDDDLPSWYEAYPYVEFSNYKDWGDVVDWALTKYVIPNLISPKLRNIVSNIKQEFKNPEDQALSALRFVQNEINYLGIELGKGGYVPRDPNTVMSRKYGDCKDKVLLLCTMLKQLGVNAYPALVHTDFKDKVENWIPTPKTFDHVIAKINIGGKSFWVDPTISQQHGKLENNYLPDYKKALLIKKSETKFSPIPFVSIKYSRYAVKEIFDVREYNTPSILTIISEYQGNQADNTREYFNSNSLIRIV